MSIILQKDKSLLLDTGLDEASFGKSARQLDFSECGTAAHVFLFQDRFEFETWNFSGTTVEGENHSVYFETNAAPGSTALEIITSSDEEKTARMTLALVKTISAAFEQNVKLPAVGLGGILYSEQFPKENSAEFRADIMFMPETIFEFSASNQDETEYSRLQGFWQNKTLKENSRLVFLQSAAAYYALTKTFPFAKTNLEQRQEDITDSNFIGIEHLVNGINKTLAQSINAGLCAGSQNSRKKTAISPELLQAELGLQNDGSYIPPRRNTKITQEQFEKKTKSKEKSMERKTAQKRILKRYSAAILFSLAALAFITNSAYKAHLESLKKPCAKNLTSFETVQTFYSGFHQQDSSLMGIVAKGSNPRKLIDMINNIYVTSTTRTAYEARNATISPELYLIRPELIDYWIFGITDFKIDGTDAYNRYKPITKQEFLLLKKAGKENRFTDGETKTHRAQYNMIYTSGADTPITVDKCTAEVFLTYKKDQWYITDISIEHNETEFSQEAFRNDFTGALQKSDSPKEAVSLLRETYDWLPDDRALDDAAALAEYQKNYFN